MSKRTERTEPDHSTARNELSQAQPATTDASAKLEASSSTGGKSKRCASAGSAVPAIPMPDAPDASVADGSKEEASIESPTAPPSKKSRTNTPWTPAEEQRLKVMRDAGNSWSEIAKTFPSRTEGSVKKHWYKDMHYAEFGEDESQTLLNAIKEYEQNKWKEIGKKVGKPAKACEQYAKEHFAGKM